MFCHLCFIFACKHTFFSPNLQSLYHFFITFVDINFNILADMDTITTWYEALDPTLRVYWSIAIATSVVFIIQMVLTFIGIGDHDADLSMPDATDIPDGDTLDTGGAMQLFTIRNLINFLLGLGWGGVCFWNTIPLRPLLAIVAVFCGSAFVAMFIFMFRQMKKLESNGAFRIRDCVGCVCTVYLRIPGAREGQGKVQISLGGSVQEISAMTEGGFIPTGARVKVVEVIDENTLLVSPV